uniref:Uncharacterized protein n=1 Tax=Manihot esculenta TaxID=3983 RepID=A0A2C9UCS3_MANES
MHMPHSTLLTALFMRKRMVVVSGQWSELQATVAGLEIKKHSPLNQIPLQEAHLQNSN